MFAPSLVSHIHVRDSFALRRPPFFYSLPTRFGLGGPIALGRLWKIRPSDISCSQDSISNEFSDGHSLDETLANLRSGQCRVEDIEKIQITWHSHRKTSPGHARWWTYTGNRRLSLFQKLEKEGCLPFIVAQWVNTPVPWWRMTTHQAGDQPRVRGSRGSK